MLVIATSRFATTTCGIVSLQASAAGCDHYHVIIPVDSIYIQEKLLKNDEDVGMKKGINCNIRTQLRTAAIVSVSLGPGLAHRDQVGLGRMAPANFRIWSVGRTAPIVVSY